MELEYIKANGIYYYARANGRNSALSPVSKIKKLKHGMFQVEYYDDYFALDRDGFMEAEEDREPTHRVILYPSGIQEIRYVRNKQV